MKTILFVSYKFHFIKEYIDYLKTKRYNVLIDEWNGHDNHDKEKSEKLLRQCDVIFCEWALHNAVWYSKKKLPHQKLYVRCHRFELDRGFMWRIKWHNVDRLIFIAPSVRYRGVELFNHMKRRSLLIYNYVDYNKYYLRKRADSQFHIGMCGWHRRLKRMDIAIKVIQNLMRHDKRYKLYFKGISPREIGWLWNNKEENHYFTKIFKLLEDDKELSERVIFEPQGDDVHLWLRNIGYILSCSDIEASHQAIVEGTCSGAIPCLVGGYVEKYRAKDMFPNGRCFGSIKNLCRNILILNNLESRRKTEMIQSMNYVKNKYNKSKIFKELDSLIV
tara:strand:- start:1159 stop:2154 length:996 start_codon:yes stop_codon:yes gene_type:complete